MGRAIWATGPLTLTQMPLTFNLRPSTLAGVLLHVDGESDRWRSEVMLMVRIDDHTRKEVPFAGFHLAQSWKPCHSLGAKAGCESLCGIELVDHVFRWGLR